MPHVITSLCLRDGGCATVCPVECIVPGQPIDQWPWYYIDPDTCIDCGACVPECPWEAIFPLDEVPAAFQAKKDVRLSQPVGTPDYTEEYTGTNHDGDEVILKATFILKAGQTIDLTPAIQTNADFFKNGPGYNAR
ncbi:MAG: ferredoxin family protein [Anaerolinea sp.]|nr:ferredoxin family protein [Anaerolinea sp.]